MRIIPKIISILLVGLFCLSASKSDAKIICCHNYYDWPGIPYSLDKALYSTSTSTIVGSDVYVEINCYSTGSNSCPSCYPANPVVKGDWATYNPDVIMAYVYNQISNGVNNGDTHFQGDPAVRVTWATEGEGGLTVTYTGNDDIVIIAP